MPYLRRSPSLENLILQYRTRANLRLWGMNHEIEKKTKRSGDAGICADTPGLPGRVARNCGFWAILLFPPVLDGPGAGGRSIWLGPCMFRYGYLPRSRQLRHLQRRYWRDGGPPAPLPFGGGGYPPNRKRCGEPPFFTERRYHHNNHAKR